MENASKALIMAAEVLIGVMVISIGVALFSSFSNFSRETAHQIEISRLAEFNNSFLKYYGKTVITTEDGKETESPIRVTSHEIISLANLAMQNNKKYDLEAEHSYNPSTNYVQIDVGKYTNLEKWTEVEKNNFIENNSLIINTETNETSSKYYYIKDYKESSITGRVMYIIFDEIKQK